jgi:hypothetical protein
MLFALSVLFAVMTLGLEARGAPPVDELTWSGEACAEGLPQAFMTATGNGKWAVMVVEVSIDGGDFVSLGEQYSPWKIEHGVPTVVAWSGDVVFRAADAKSNGSVVGDWIVSAAIDCP